MQHEAKLTFLSVSLIDPVLNHLDVLVEAEKVGKVKDHKDNVRHTLVVSLPEILDQACLLTPSFLEFYPRALRIKLSQLGPDLLELLRFPVYLLVFTLRLVPVIAVRWVSVVTLRLIVLRFTLLAW